VRNFQGKKNNRLFLYSWPVLFILFIVLLLFVYGVFTLFGKMRETAKNKEIAQVRLANLENRKKKLERDIEELSNDKGKERIFREDYGLARPGEGVIVIVDEKNSDIVEIDAEKKGFWGLIRAFFGF